MIVHDRKSCEQFICSFCLHQPANAFFFFQLGEKQGVLSRRRPEGMVIHGSNRDVILSLSLRLKFLGDAREHLQVV